MDPMSITTYIFPKKKDWMAVLKDEFENQEEKASEGRAKN